MVPPMAEMSPTCSIIVAKAIGTIMMIEEIRKPALKLSAPKRLNTVFSRRTGRPIQAASLTALKSTLPVRAATM